MNSPAQLSFDFSQKPLWEIARERDARAETEGASYVWKLIEPGVYSCSNPKSRATHRVTLKSCSCEDYRRVCEPAKTTCKHSRALLDRMLGGK